MVNGPSKPKGNTPWFHDTKALFGRDDPITPWQMSGIGLDDVDDDERCHDDDVNGALRALRQGRRTSPIVISPESRARAEEMWRSNRSLHQSALAESWGETHVGPISQLGDVDDDLSQPHIVETALTGYIRKNAWILRQAGGALKFGDLLSYIREVGTDFVPQLWLVHSQETDVAVRPSHLAVVGRLSLDDVVGLHIVTMDNPEIENFQKSHIQLWFEYNYSDRRYMLTKAKGPSVFQAAFLYLESCGVHLKSQVERLLVARLLDGRLDTNNVHWSELASEMETQTDFFSRLLQVKHQISARADKVPEEFVFAATRETGDIAGSLRILTVQEAKDAKLKPVMAQLYVTTRESGKMVLHKVRGTGSQDLGFAWVAGQVGRPLELIEKAMVASVWKTHFLFEPDSLPTWQRLCDYLKTPNALQRLWGLRDYVVPTSEQMPAKIVLVARRERTLEKTFSGLRLLSQTEYEHLTPSADLAAIHLEKKGDRYEVVFSKGTGAKEIVDALNSKKEEGGVTFAPDAAQIDNLAQEVASYSSKNFGNLDKQICKPEPLINPADVMPVPQLERPVDGVELPREGGFQVTDPEAVRKFATPPSDKIPVITAVSAMIVSAVAFFYGGAALMRAPVANPAFGSGGIFVSPRDSHYPEGI